MWLAFYSHRDVIKQNEQNYGRAINKNKIETKLQIQKGAKK